MLEKVWKLRGATTEYGRIVSIRIVLEKVWKSSSSRKRAEPASFNPHRVGEGLEVQEQRSLLAGTGFNPHRVGEGLEAYPFRATGRACIVSIRIVLEKVWKRRNENDGRIGLCFNPHRVGEGLEELLSKVTICW